MITILFVIFPSTLSFAVAPASVYVSPTERVIDAWPFNAITGGVVSGGLFTVTLLSIDAVLLDESVMV